MKFQAVWQSLFVLVFVGYVFIWSMLPTETYYNSWSPELTKKLSSTYFREQGTNLVLFSFPLILVAVLGCVYLHLQRKSGGPERSSKSFPDFLRRPQLVMSSSIGIVNATELMFAAAFVLLLIWSLVNYLLVSWKHLFVYRDNPDETAAQAKFRSVSLILGYIGNTCWAFLFFPVTRGSSLLPLIGLTSESSIKYHIWLGHISTLLFAAHTVGYIIFWWPITHQIYLMLQYISNIAGVIAIVLSLGIWVTSFQYFRRKMFEVFFYTHHLYTLYIFFYFLHVGVGCICLILPGIFLFLIDRYLRFLQSRQKARLLSVRLLPNSTLEMTFAKDPGLSYTPTSILFIHVRSVSKLQWHPFTITSNSNFEPDKLSIAIKAQGNWTQKLYAQLTSLDDYLNVSTEGPYRPASSHYFSRETLVMISGGSGITPFISIIRECIFRSTQTNKKVPKIFLVTAFKDTVDLTMLDLLLPLSSNTLDISKLQIQIEAYVTREHHEGSLGEDDRKHIRARLFKPNRSDSPISDVLGKNSWLWLGAIISSSFALFLLLLGFVTRYHIYPVERRGANYHYALKVLWDMFLVCVSIFVAASCIFLWQKKTAEKQSILNVDVPTPTTLPDTWLCVTDREVENLSQQSIVQSTKVHYGSRPDLKRMLLDSKGSDVGVMVCGPKSLRHDVARICASSAAKNLHLESISFSW